MKALNFLKHFFISLIFVITFSFPFSSEIIANPNETHYEKVLIEGIWWIFVYEDGVLVNSYPDDDID